MFKQEFSREFALQNSSHREEGSHGIFLYNRNMNQILGLWLFGRSRVGPRCNYLCWWTKEWNAHLNIYYGYRDREAIGLEHCACDKEAVEWKINHPYTKWFWTLSRLEREDCAASVETWQHFWSRLILINIKHTYMGEKLGTPVNGSILLQS